MGGLWLSAAKNFPSHIHKQNNEVRSYCHLGSLCSLLGCFVCGYEKEKKKNIHERARGFSRLFLFLGFFSFCGFFFFGADFFFRLFSVLLWVPTKNSKIPAPANYKHHFPLTESVWGGLVLVICASLGKGNLNLLRGHVCRGCLAA